MAKMDIKKEWVFSPQPMHLLGTTNKDGGPNFCIIPWINFSFHKTPLLMLPIGGSKQTKTNILRDGVYSANHDLQQYHLACRFLRDDDGRGKTATNGKC